MPSRTMALEGWAIRACHQNPYVSIKHAARFEKHMLKATMDISMYGEAYLENPYYDVVAISADVILGRRAGEHGV